MVVLAPSLFFLFLSHRLWLHLKQLWFLLISPAINPVIQSFFSLLFLLLLLFLLHLPSLRNFLFTFFFFFGGGCPENRLSAWLGEKVLYFKQTSHPHCQQKVNQFHLLWLEQLSTPSHTTTPPKPSQTLFLCFHCGLQSLASHMAAERGPGRDMRFYLSTKEAEPPMSPMNAWGRMAT